MKLLECLLTHSRCYEQRKNATMTPHGIVMHDTAAGNAYLKRYVQPYTGDLNYDKLMEELGTNQYGNDWNHDRSSVKGVHDFIGKLQNGTLAAVQTLPHNIKCNGCGSGSKGSLNNCYLQIEICDDGYKDQDYCNQTYELAVEYVAKLCKQYNLDPCGTYVYSKSNGKVNVPVITCHQDAYKLGLASNHSDVLVWWKKYGKTMAQFRLDVKAKMTEEVKTIEATQNAASATTAAVTVVNTADVRTVTANSLNVRYGAGTTYKVLTTLKKGKSVTILKISTDGEWGRIEYAAGKHGWIALKYTKKS